MFSMQHIHYQLDSIKSFKEGFILKANKPGLIRT